MIRRTFFVALAVCLALGHTECTAQQRATGGAGGSSFGGSSLFGGGNSIGGGSAGFGQSGFGQSGFGQSSFGQTGFGQGQQGGQNNNGFVGRSGADSQAFFQQLGRGSNQFFQRLERSFSRGGNRGRGAAQPQERRPPVRVQLSLGFTPELDVVGRGANAATRVAKSLDAKGFDNAQIEIVDGVAFLTGEAPSISDRRLIERLARLEPGVNHVENQLTVAGETLELPVDAEPIPPASGI